MPVGVTSAGVFASTRCFSAAELDHEARVWREHVRQLEARRLGFGPARRAHLRAEACARVGHGARPGQAEDAVVLQRAPRRWIRIHVPRAVAARFYALVPVGFAADAHETGAAIAEIVAQDAAHAAAQKIRVGVRVPEPEHVHVALARAFF